MSTSKRRRTDDDTSYSEGVDRQQIIRFLALAHMIQEHSQNIAQKQSQTELAIAREQKEAALANLELEKVKLKVAEAEAASKAQATARAPAPNGAAFANASDFGCNPGAEDNTTCPSALALDEPMDTDYAQNGYAYDATSGYSYSTTTADFASNHAGPSHSGGYTEEYAPWDEAGNVYYDYDDPYRPGPSG